MLVFQGRSAMMGGLPPLHLEKQTVRSSFKEILAYKKRSLHPLLQAGKSKQAINCMSLVAVAATVPHKHLARLQGQVKMQLHSVMAKQQADCMILLQIPRQPSKALAVVQEVPQAQAWWVQERHLT